MAKRPGQRKQVDDLRQISQLVDFKRLVWNGRKPEFVSECRQNCSAADQDGNALVRVFLQAPPDDLESVAGLLVRTGVEQRMYSILAGIRVLLDRH